MQLILTGWEGLGKTSREVIYFVINYYYLENKKKVKNNEIGLYTWLNLERKFSLAQEISFVSEFFTSQRHFSGRRNCLAPPQQKQAGKWLFRVGCGQKDETYLFLAALLLARTGLDQAIDF